MLGIITFLGMSLLWWMMGWVWVSGAWFGLANGLVVINLGEWFPKYFKRLR